MRNSKLLLGALTIILLGGGLILAIFAAQNRIPILPRAGSSFSLSINPATQSVAAGQNIIVTLNLQSQSVEIKESSLIINYNPAFLALTGAPKVDKKLGKITKNTKPTAANKTGTYTVSAKAGASAKGLTGSGTLLTLKFKAKAATPTTTQVRLDPSSILKDKAGINLITVTTTITPGIYTITGKPDPNAPSCDSLDIEPTTGPAPLTVIATISATPAKKPIAQYVFNFTGTDEPQTTNLASHTFTTDGTYDIKAYVIDTTNKYSQVCSANLQVTSSSNGDGKCSQDANCPSGQACVSGTCQDKNKSQSSCPSESNPACYDCNHDGAINILDYSCFNNIYGKQKDSGGSWK